MNNWLGVVSQAHEGDFHPFRRRIDYVDDAQEVSLSAITNQLELTASEHWGYRLRLGLVPLSDADAATIRAAMTGRS